ncbi:hypothetical protein SAMD00019534_033610 [Acytostelium subglobosum LB1]|uniref:hypothetical protein n=1 Tax=Acytostelium subglobosum LB1 TaxID=1410327 RepID=UPI0006448BB9|nr:hypothetical protein SAMD00019534_033610 [Acytostelium subglobosum LB1]GAM20186.1 hypothetical protein SAMD00019534_033610 [Acytostelium subglobosum LB1]|eukprot:XP_012759707.1 hypothetical protein SAMD00019534_033610 [Acytostelium subglobosum LB1]
MNEEFHKDGGAGGGGENGNVIVMSTLVDPTTTTSSSMEGKTDCVLDHIGPTQTLSHITKARPLKRASKMIRIANMMNKPTLASSTSTTSSNEMADSTQQETSAPMMKEEIMMPEETKGQESTPAQVIIVQPEIIEVKSQPQPQMVEVKPQVQMQQPTQKIKPVPASRPLSTMMPTHMETDKKEVKAATETVVANQSIPMAMEEDQERKEAEEGEQVEPEEKTEKFIPKGAVNIFGDAKFNPTNVVLKKTVSKRKENPGVDGPDSTAAAASSGAAQVDFRSLLKPSGTSSAPVCEQPLHQDTKEEIPDKTAQTILEHVHQDFEESVAEPAPTAVEVEYAPTTESFKYEDIIGKKVTANLMPSKLEAYLSDDEFAKVMECTKDAFYQLPLWKQTNLKKKADLY